MATHYTDDRRKLDQILREVHKFKRSAVKVGVLANAKKHKSTEGPAAEMVQIAASHEFGAKIKVTEKMRMFLHSIGIHLKKATSYIIIPERSWLRNWVDENKTRIDNTIADALKQVEGGTLTAPQALKQLGVWAANGIKVKIARGPFVPLKFREGKPLNDTAQFRNSINYQVVKR